MDMKQRAQMHLLFRIVAVILLAPIAIIIQFWGENISRGIILAFATLVILVVAYAAFAKK